MPALAFFHKHVDINSFLSLLDLHAHIPVDDAVRAAPRDAAWPGHVGHLGVSDKGKQLTISAQVSVSEAHTKARFPEAPELWSWLKVAGGDSHPAEEEAGWGQDSLREEAAQTAKKNKGKETKKYTEVLKAHRLLI